ncbi:c-type cytochrome [Stigmatella erecta]|uniref:Cytochrome c n=1 Tax=Stigmatella erecta TaxID=83460 RepID=A0A1H9YPQ4_9BACT|nr:c-type cytochrome [Stigmatella erecta]SES71119.1 Cytochrome c [Stigmatella erecta]
MSRDPNVENGLGVLEDLTPVQRAERRWRQRALLVLALVLLVLLGFSLYRAFHPNAPVTYEDIEEHFKYGSLGSELAGGIPYYIFQILPELCADKLPRPSEGYASLGFVFEPGRDLPIGTSKRRVLVDRVGLNCALCHSGTVREAPGSKPRIYLAMPANNLDLRGYVEFFSMCAADPRFTPENVMAYIDRRFELGWMERFAYRYVAVDATRQGLLKQASAMSFMFAQPHWGPGRVDTFNPYKTLQFNFDMSKDKSVGTTDYAAVWNQGPREAAGMDLHWDGNNKSVHERNMSAALGIGVVPSSLDCGSLNRIEAYLKDLHPPGYPFPINNSLASRGKPLFEQHCASCHAFGGAQTGKVTPLSEIKTDRERLDVWSYPLLANFNTLYAGYDGKAGEAECRHVFTSFRKTDGYANVPLDGIWLRSPYLHNGSVPTLKALLEPPQKRPQRFYRGYDVFDQENVGFVSSVEKEGENQFFLFDTQLRGNSNDGHEFGVDLAPDDKRALVEFMKTL